MLHPGSAGLILLLALLAGTVTAGRGSVPPARVDRLAWLAGCWERTSPNGRVDEQWMTPHGGMMLGMSRTVRDGSTIGWESLRIYERDERLVYAAQPSGQSSAEFVSTIVTADSVSFENPEHDFPQRIVYRLAGDSLFARIEGNTGAAARTLDFPFARATCPAGGPGNGD